MIQVTYHTVIEENVDGCWSFFSQQSVRVGIDTLMSDADYLAACIALNYTKNPLRVSATKGPITAGRGLDQ